MLKKCKICGTTLGKDGKSGNFWCMNCKEVRTEYDLKYKICILGKNTGREIGKNNYIKKLGESIEKLGHEVIEIRFSEVYDYIYPWNTTEYFVEKREIPLEFIDHIHNPDFIVVEQTYNRFDISRVSCPVIYIHREYTHFPDIEIPNILLGSYPNRLEVFEFNHPNDYNSIPFCDELFVATDPSMFTNDKEKLIKGITMIGWATNPYNFANANGVLAKMVIEDQVAFYQECVKKGYVQYINGKKFLHYREILELCEAVLIDGGYVNAFGRRLFEAAVSKTLCIVRVHSMPNRDILTKIGLTEDMCYFVYNPEDIEEILENWDSDIIKEKIEKAYNWVMDNHTYDIRAKQLLKIFEDYKKGLRRKKKFMGYAVHSDVQLIDGKVIYEALI